MRVAAVVVMGALASAGMARLDVPTRAVDQASASGLVGTWRLIEYTSLRDGKVIHAFGEKPPGLFMYAASGYVSIHLLHNPLPQQFDDLNLSTPQQDLLGTRSYTGYFGRYEVDVARSVVTHLVEGGTLRGTSARARSGRTGLRVTS